jgi:copper resistance protein C
VLAVSVFVASSVAFAHPKLLSSTPSDKAEGPPPAKIELHFSEALVPEFSAANVVMTAMPGMDMHSPMKVAFTVTGDTDGKTMVITPRQPLTTGTYRVDWRAVSTDTHRVTGNFSFEVK